MSFEFMTANRIIFGDGVREQLPTLAQTLGKQALIVTGAHPDRIQGLLDALMAKIACVPFAIRGEPTIENVLEGVALAKDHACDVVIAIGGGSVLDGGKAIATLVTNQGDPFDYLEVIGKGNPITQSPLPMMAVPTTAGTGSEVTRNAVVSSAQHHTKVSMRSPLMLPTIALVDPELTVDMPASITAYTGMDALTQLIEPYTTPFANPLTDAICAEGIPRAGRSLLLAVQNGQDRQARYDMALASVFGGLALANARLGAVHGFANPIGGMFDAPHGAICAILLPEVMAMNTRKLRNEGKSIMRYEQVARWLTHDQYALAEDGVAWVKGLVDTLKIPRLGTWGIGASDLDNIIEKSAKASSMKGNAVAFTFDDMREILQNCL
jgi:alcohol dehydrogenase class IV